MFRKIVSNLAFSPALVGQLGFYAKRLKKEEATRRIGIIFTVLALVVQSFAVFSPPESANAASGSDFVYGGVTSLNQFIDYYDRNVNNLKDIYDSLGITRQELLATKAGTINSKEAYSWGRQSRFSAAQGEGAYTYDQSGGSKGTVFYRPLHLWDSKPYTIRNGSTYSSYIGHSAKIGWFAIMKNCGNLATKTPPPAPTPAPQPTPAPAPKPTPIPVQPVVAPPSAACKSLTYAISQRTHLVASAIATASNGAKISSYTFTVRNTNNRVVSTQKVTTNRHSSAAVFNVAHEGSYRLAVVVSTTVGSKTSQKCQKQFTIVPPAVCAYNSKLPQNSPDCQPCPGDGSLWIKDEKCVAEIVRTKKATNLTQGSVDATSLVANASNRISYNVTIENKGKVAIDAVIKENLDDVLEYATIIDSGNGEYDKKAKTLSWPEVNLKPGEQQTRVFVVQLASTIPAVTTGTSDKTSYDCTMTNTFGNSIDIAVECPPAKVVEQVVQELPKTGAGANLIFSGGVLAVVVYFYTRSRQLKTEVRLIRRELNTGTL